jgi:hypothetical protein
MVLEVNRLRLVDNGSWEGWKEVKVFGEGKCKKWRNSEKSGMRRGEQGFCR